MLYKKLLGHAPPLLAKRPVLFLFFGALFHAQVFTQDAQFILLQDSIANDSQKTIFIKNGFIAIRDAGLLFVETPPQTTENPYPLGITAARGKQPKKKAELPAGKKIVASRNNTTTPQIFYTSPESREKFAASAATETKAVTAQNQREKSTSQKSRFIVLHSDQIVQICFFRLPSAPVCGRFSYDFAVRPPPIYYNFTI